MTTTTTTNATPCDHGPGCCVSCCPAEPDSSGTGPGCRVCKPDTWTGDAERDRDERGGFAALFGGRAYW